MGCAMEMWLEQMYVDGVCFEFVVASYYVAAGRFRLSIVDSLLQSSRPRCVSWQLMESVSAFFRVNKSHFSLCIPWPFLL